VNISDSPLQIGLLGAAARADVRALPGGATVPSAPVAARAFLPQVRSTSPGWQIHPPDRYVRTARRTGPAFRSWGRITGYQPWC